MDIDWKKAANGTKEIYPEATYKVRITNWEDCTASTGTPQVRWFAEIVKPEEPHGGKTIVEHTPLTETSLFRIANFVQACGISLDNVDKMVVGSAAFKAILDSCKERTTYWKVTVNEEFGNNKIDDYLLDEEQEIIEPKTPVDASPFATKE